MYKLYKSLRVWSLVLGMGLFFLTVPASPVLADENRDNLPPDANMMGMMVLQSIDLPFDPNDFTFLVYDPEGVESRIEAAMSKLGIPCDVRDADNEVTANDLATHDILIVGENNYGSVTGLDEEDLAVGIKGRVILATENAENAEKLEIRNPTFSILNSADSPISRLQKRRCNSRIADKRCLFRQNSQSRKLRFRPDRQLPQEEKAGVAGT